MKPEDRERIEALLEASGQEMVGLFSDVVSPQTNQEIRVYLSSVLKRSSKHLDLMALVDQRIGLLRKK